MKKPMKTVKAYSLFICKECRKGNFDKCEAKKYGGDCTEDKTCSAICMHCRGRIWFTGNWSDDTTPEDFTCPYCGKETSSPYKGL